MKYSNQTVVEKLLNAVEVIGGEEPAPVEALVDEPVSFEPPAGLAFMDFKFNHKAVLDVMSNFIPSTKKPEESELFATNLSEIPGDGTFHESTLCQDKLPPDECVRTNVATKTPVLAFKEREGIAKKTPTSTPKRLSMSASKRTSLTPNPKNFLHKIEDPIAQQMETPKSQRKFRQPDMSSDNVSESVKHFTALVATEEAKFQSSLQKWEKIQEENSAPEEGITILYIP